MHLLGKYLFMTSDLSWPKNGVYRALRRINRETKSQYISDVQRVPYCYNKNGKRVFDWKRYEWFQKIAKRFIKNKLFNEDGTLTEYYGKTTLIDGDYSSMLSDTNFNDMFRIVKGDGRNDLWEFESNSIAEQLKGIFKKTKVNKGILHPVCIDTNSHIGTTLKKDFGVDVYIVDRMWDDKRFVYDRGVSGHYSHNHQKSCDFDRNAVFHQITNSGADKSIIRDEDNKSNKPILIWFFEDRIVYKEEGGRSEF